MRLKWNPTEFWFEAEFHDFQGDLDAVKAAGFKTLGPPGWIWYTQNISVLEKLRKNRPVSGLTIFEDALKEYNRLKEEDEKKKDLLAELKAAKKLEPEIVIESVPEGQEFGYHCLKPKNINPPDYKIKPWTGPVCQVCGGDVQFYEQQDPPLCLWCEKQLESAPDLFG